MNPNSLLNLNNPWQPGQSGNPNGRPKNTECLTYWLRLYQDYTIAELDRIDKKQCTAAQLIALQQIKQALKANQPATEHMWNRLEGRVPQQISHAGKVEIEVKRDGG